MSFVWVLNPSGRQIKVKTVPTKTVLTIIEEVCEKSSLNPDSFDLVTAIQRRPLDASAQWRFTSIPNNAKLELVESTRPRVTLAVTVKVAIQTPTGRIIGTATTDMTIYAVLCELKMESPGPDQFPVISFSGKECPLEKTLKQIGVLSGNVLLRAHFRPKTADDDKIVSEIIHRENTKKTESAGSIKSECSAPEVPMETSKTPDSLESFESKTANSHQNKPEMDRLPNGAKATFKDFKFPSSTDESMEVEEKSVERLPCGLKPTFSDFKFPENSQENIPLPGNDTTNNKKVTQEETSRKRLPNGQLAQFSNFKFDKSKPSTSKDAKEKSKPKENPYPFLDFKFPDNPTVPIQIDEQAGPSSKVDQDILPPVVIPADRKYKLYDINEIKINGMNQMDVDDAIFDVTVDDLKKIKATSQKEAPLLTDQLRSRNKMRQRAADYEKHPECLIKINFANNLTAEIIFHPGETISAVMEQVVDITVGLKIKEVFTTPPKTILDPNSTVWDAGLFPRGTCYVSSNEVKFKTEIWQNRIKEMNVSEESSKSNEQTGTSQTKTDTNQNSSSDKTSEPSMSSNNTDKYSSKSDGKKVPKWFKGTGKSYK